MSSEPQLSDVTLPSHSLSAMDETATLSANDISEQFLTFTIGAEEFGVDIMTVREVKGWSDTTRLPNSPPSMRGVLNLRGIVVPIFDLRKHFSGEDTQATDKHVIVILAIGERIAGVLVDAVSDILTVSQSEIKAAPETNSGVEARFVRGLIAVQERMVVVLEMQRLLDINAIDEMQHTAGSA